MTGGGDGRVPLGDCHVSKDTESESGGDGSESSSPLRLGSPVRPRLGLRRTWAETGTFRMSGTSQHPEYELTPVHDTFLAIASYQVVKGTR